MKTSLKGRNFMHINDFTREELTLILETTRELKLESQRGLFPKYLGNKALGLIFDQPSTRTRISFELGIQQLGGYALYLKPGEIHLGKKETIYDTAKVLSRYLDGIMIRWNNRKEMQELADAADVPVINGMTEDNHPCQALADVYTMMERFGSLEGRKVVFFGDRTQPAHSLAMLCGKLGINYVQCAPKPYQMLPEWSDPITAACAASGATFIQTDDVDEATKDADMVYTDVWWWIGQEHEVDERRKAFHPYRVTEEVMAKCKDSAIFEHCLPASRGTEVTDGVMDGPHSAIFDQAENRMHTEKAVMVLTMGK